jgi:hypothetical protein
MSVRMMEQLLGEQSSNAYEWSKAFCGAYEELFDVTLDHSYVHTVFANAIMASLDGRHNQEIQKPKADREALIRALKDINKSTCYGLGCDDVAEKALKSIGELND